KKSPNTSAFRSRNTCAFYNMTHSDEFSPEFMTVVSGIRYINVDESQKICHDTQNTLAARNFNFIDADGSATGTGTPTIVGSGDINFWKVDSRCVKQPDWGLWLCPKDSNRSVASVQLAGIERSGLATHLWGVGGNEAGRTNSYPATFIERQHISGPSASGWHVALGQVPHEISVRVKSIKAGSWLVLSFTLPESKLCWIDDWNKATNLAGFKSATSNTFFVDASTGSCMVKIMGLQDGLAFTRESLSLPEISDRNPKMRFTIKTSCRGQPCTVANPRVPGYSL
ncbi:MAG TPA: hypothetical protein VE954_04355, partial [Oligoflexus sp.]|uniref:hypothetical protein n=1 Tax=Oligoflexus sp. TaxID=1971216 RepID=UPI002D692D50